MKRNLIQRPRKRKLERNVEDRAVRHAKERGWVARKMNGLGFRSWPDRLFLPPHSERRHHLLVRAFWVEFKRPGEEPTPDQARVHRDLRARGEVVHVCDSFDAFVEVFAAIHRGS